MNYFYLVTILALLFCIYMLARNTWVYTTRMRICRESIKEYGDLMSYEDMMLRFWVFDINKLKRK